jgi:hypothetical protein
VGTSGSLSDDGQVETAVHAFESADVGGVL